MKDISNDVRTECAALDDLVSARMGEFGRRTAFFDWSVADQIMHLHLVDVLGLQSMQDSEGFLSEVARVRAGQARGVELSQLMRERFGHLDPVDLLESWRGTWHDLCDFVAGSDPKARMKWFGPDMSIRSFASARQMEVWAHGQDIHDLFRVCRANMERIRNICDLGVRTFGWSFANRGEKAPAAAVSVILTSPAGATWTWNPDGEESIDGPAEDFALVVTQRRHVDDTTLRVTGTTARRWMEIAQCFAGKAETGPAPGVRVVGHR